MHLIFESDESPDGSMCVRVAASDKESSVDKRD